VKLSELDSYKSQRMTWRFSDCQFCSRSVVN